MWVVVKKKLLCKSLFSSKLHMCLKIKPRHFNPLPKQKTCDVQVFTKRGKSDIKQAGFFYLIKKHLSPTPDRKKGDSGLNLPQPYFYVNLQGFIGVRPA